MNNGAKILLSLLSAAAIQRFSSPTNLETFLIVGAALSSVPRYQRKKRLLQRVSTSAFDRAGSKRREEASLASDSDAARASVAPVRRQRI